MNTAASIIALEILIDAGARGQKETAFGGLTTKDRRRFTGQRIKSALAIGTTTLSKKGYRWELFHWIKPL